MTRLDGRMKFSTIECARCGGTRVMELPCPECGKTPPAGEVNSPVVRRRQIVDRVRALAADGTRIAVAGASQQPNDELRALVDLFFSSLAGALSGSGSDEIVAKLADAIRRTDGLIAALEITSRRRPAAEARACLGIARELARLWPIYLEAICTADIGHAEILAARGQRILDESTTALSKLATVREAANVLGRIREEPSLVTRVFRALSIQYPDLDFAGLVQLGVEHASSASGQEIGTGSSVDFLTIEMVAEAYLDPLALEAKLHELAVLARNRNRLLEVADMADALSDLGTARRDLFESLVQFQRIIADERDPAVMLRRLSKTLGELYEASLPFFVWCRLILSQPPTDNLYGKLVERDATEHVDRLARMLPETFSDAPAYIRHAAHHGRAIDIDGAAQTIQFRLRSFKGSQSMVEFVDTAYAFLESLLAICWSVTNALEVSGVSVPLPPGAARYMGLTPEALTTLWLTEFKGVRVLLSEARDDGWWIEADIPEHETLTIALTLASFRDTASQSVTVVTAGSTVAPVRLRLDDYRWYADRTAIGVGDDLPIALIELRHRMTSNGACLVTESDIEFAVVCLGLAVMNGELASIARLRAARNLAMTHGFSSLVTLANQVLATIRSGDDWDAKVALAQRTKSFTTPQFPAGPAFQVLLSDGPPVSARPCD